MENGKKINGVIILEVWEFIKNANIMKDNYKQRKQKKYLKKNE